MTLLLRPEAASPGWRLDSALSRVTIGQIDAELPDAQDGPKSLNVGRSLFAMADTACFPLRYF